MKPLDVIKLVFLAAIWGCSFIFLRVIVPEIGPLMTALLRMALSAIALMGFALVIGTRMHWRKNAVNFAWVGLFATVMPFTCFSFASQYLPAAYSALLNATSPLFGALFSVLWLAERMSMRKLAGLALGVAGVAVIVGAGALALNLQSLGAIAACLFAAASYAISSIIVKRTGHPADGSDHHIDPIAMATGSMVMGALILLPALPFILPAHFPTLPAVGAILGLSLLSSGVAQAMFVPLIVRIGPTKAMSVAFLIPVFGILWGYLFLGERVATATLVGGAIVLAAMALVLSASHTEPEDTMTAEA
jgi:drug/metabolite transporter (DMT)-like permease